MKVLELFAGFAGFSNACKARGHETFTIDWDERFDVDLHADISKLKLEDLPEEWRHPDVIFAGTQCFEAGTLVFTKDGYKEIQNVQCNDYVLTHNNNYKRVYKTFKNNKNYTYKIKISGCEEMICSDNHPFLVRRKHTVNTHKNGENVYYSELLNPEWIECKDLSTDYKVGIPINQESIIPQWNGVVMMKGNNYGVYKTWIKNELQQYMNNNDFWWIVGRYFGDGYLSKPNKNLHKNTYNIDICCNMDEINEIKPVLDRLKIPYTERDQNIHHFNIFDKEFHYFLSQFGIGAENKEITPTILNLPKDLLKSFIDGYLSADGHLDNHTKNPCYSITTISRKLAYGLQQCILKSYNRYCSLRVNSNPNNVICGRIVNTHTAYILSFYRDESKRFQYVIEDGMAWVNVREVEKLPTKQHILYNLSVEDDESYTVNNICVHNCTTYSVAAISKHRTKDKETGALLPKSEQAKHDDKMNRHVRELMKEMNPKIIIFENPMGGFRKMDFVQDLILNTTTYCQWGFTYRKQTDFMSNIDLHLRPPCKNGDTCHEKAPRGARTGLQAIKDPALKAVYPPELCTHLVKECEDYIRKN